MSPPSPTSVALQQAAEAAAAAYDEREYNPFAPSFSQKDPWDDDVKEKDAWVAPVIRTLEKYLPPPEVPRRVVTPPQRPAGDERVSKSLNLSRGYAEHWERYSCRELVQNWFDACVERCECDRHQVEVMTIEAPPCALSIGADGVIYVALHGDRLAGYLADYDDSDGHRCVELVNYGGAIMVDAMVLGNSSKRGMSSATGFFGEGVKVEINRLVANGASVEYETPVPGTDEFHSMWTFSYEEEISGASEVLHLHVDTVGGPTDAVAVTVKGLPAGNSAISPNNFLFLQGKYTRVVAPPTDGNQVAGIDVLLDPQHEGRIYVGGIFALPWATLKGIGLDYTGSGESFQKVGLGRDRSSVHVHELINLLPSAFVHQRGTPEARMLLERIFDTLQAHSHSEMAWIRDCPYDGPLTRQAREWWLEFADALVALFVERYSNLAVPCEAHEISLVHEAKGMGFTAVTVSFPLKATLEGSPRCPTMEKLRHEFFDSMLSLPDLELDLQDKNDKRLGQVRKAVVKFFGTELSLDSTCFKKLPTGNSRLVVPVAGKFIIDYNLMQVDEVYKELARQGVSITFDPRAAQSLALVRGFVHAIAGTDDVRKANLESRVMHALMEENMRGGAAVEDEPGSPNRSPRSSSRRPTDEAPSELELDGATGEDGEDEEGESALAELMRAATADSDDEQDPQSTGLTTPPRRTGGAAPVSPGPSPGPSPGAPVLASLDDFNRAVQQLQRGVEVPDLHKSLGRDAFRRLNKVKDRMETTHTSFNFNGSLVPPKEFLCPLTLEIFVEPVVAADGFTYERGAIQIWFEAHDRSPVTNLPLPTTHLYPNFVLRAIINDASASPPTGPPARSTNGRHRDPPRAPENPARRHDEEDLFAQWHREGISDQRLPFQSQPEFSPASSSPLPPAAASPVDFNEAFFESLQHAAAEAETEPTPRRRGGRKSRLSPPAGFAPMSSSRSPGASNSEAHRANSNGMRRKSFTKLFRRSTSGAGGGTK
uniref:U-box domain-containing protein n=1 Tax=Rhizochromulina marina TaxID=1034831 RepID=A0A7S2W1H5_9STRA|mmetsp:Transcript_12136/g.35125  ORF Transcript_12136/g.35125 Transcript_12136/m.35125 type:complete len:995 (+) Transcript_12136:243-3227(+)